MSKSTNSKQVFDIECFLDFILICHKTNKAIYIPYNKPYYLYKIWRKIGENECCDKSD